jgi:transcriptional regulator with XRE-family HTH domain
MTTDEEIGTAIRRARERRGWTQQQLADEVGVSLRAVGDWERGRTSPRNAIGRLEQVLGISLSETPLVPEIETPPVSEIEALRLIPILLDEIERLRKENDQLRAGGSMVPESEVIKVAEIFYDAGRSHGRERQQRQPPTSDVITTGISAEAIGTRIRERRQVLGMTQAELGARVGVHRASVGAWERGKHLPVRKLGAIEKVLGIRFTEKAGRQAHEPGPPGRTPPDQASDAARQHGG